MANKTWKNAADGIWTVGSNWSDGSAPSPGDTASFVTSGGYTTTLPKGAYSLGALNMGARYATLALNGSSLNVGNLSLTAGVLKNGVLSGASLAAGAANGGIAVLDGMTVAGTVRVGAGAGPALTIQNGLTLAAGAAVEFAGTSGQLAADGTQSITGGTIIVDAGNTTKIQTGTGAGALALNGTALEVQGTLTANRVTVNGAVHVASGGTLFLGSSNAATTTFGANARLAVDGGGKLQLTQAVTTGVLVDFAAKVTRAASAMVMLAGDIDNAGRTLDLSAGSAVASNVSLTGDRITGGTIFNNGAATSLNFGALYGVTLRGLFRADSADISSLTVRDSLTVLNADGSAGTLNLANAGTALVVDSVGGSTAGTFTLANMTLVAANINVAVATVLDATFTASFAVSGGIHGTVVNRGTVSAAPGVYLDLGGGSGLNGSGAAGSFENDGTVTVGAGGNLTATAGFVNKGVVRLAGGSVATFGGVSVGTISVEGQNVRLGFNARGVTGSLVGLNSDDQLFLQMGAAGSAAASVSGQTLTLSEDGATVATFDLGQDGWSSSDFSTAISGGTVVVSNTHGTSTGTTPVTTTPVTTTPTITTPTTPVVTIPPLNTGGTLVASGHTLHDRPLVGDTASASWAADGRPDLAFSNGTTGAGGVTKFDAAATGGPDYIRWAYIMSGPDNMAFATNTPNVFIHSGAGMDAIAVKSGNNVLDGGTGSNFLTGGTGNDVFFTDVRPTEVTWSTLINFHQGDEATIWGFKEGVSTMRWSYYDATGKDGVSGANLDISVGGGAGRNGSGLDARVTFAGMSVAQASSMLHSTGNIDGGEGAYLHFYNQGV